MDYNYRRFKITALIFFLGSSFLQVKTSLALAIPSYSTPTQHTSAPPVNNSWLEISQSQLDANIQKVQYLLDDQSTLCAILKGDAYGHGLDLVMPVMLKNNVSCIGVASNQEIKTVLNAGFAGRLMRVRIASLDEVEQGIDDDVEELVGSQQFAEHLNDMAKARGKTMRIHLALNSGGMSRNGLEVTRRGLKEIRAITQLSNLNIVGIMSHYPEENTESMKAGLARFNTQVEQIFATTDLTREQVKLHIANTFAMLNVPETWLDMVRVGGVFYGDMLGNDDYARVMTLKSKVAALHRYPKGNTVGYDRTYMLTRDSILANIPIGYADGYRRAFSNQGHVLIQGQRVPVLGKVSMNTIVVDVTDLQNVNLGDEVVLFGKQGSAEISADEVEEITDALFTEMSILWGATNPKVLVE